MSAEEQDERSLRDYVDIIKRRRKTIVATAVVCLAITLALAFLLPARFRSTGTILIEQQEVPQDLVRSTVTSYADQRVQTISQRVMTTQNLLEIIRKFDLYSEQRKRESREELIERMRDDIDFKMISADVVDPRSGIPRQATIAFSVGYTSAFPEQAVKVANELTTLYLNENLTERTRLAQDAASFLQDESARISAHIADLEAKIAQFKSQHLNELPELAQLNMQLLDRTSQTLRDDETRLMSLDQQRVFLEAQLAQVKPNSVLMTDDGTRVMSSADRLKALKTQLASAQARYGAIHPDIARLKREIAGLEAEVGAQPATNDLLRELDDARAQLAQVRDKYSANHPDVQRLERRVASLEAALAAERATQPAAAAQPSDSTESPDNPAYIQLMGQLSATKNDIAALQAQIQELRAQAAEYREKITATPQIEREYRALMRDYESSQLKYQEVRNKQMEAQLAQNLEADRKGEKFTLIEPPLPPEKPVSPNRTLILFAGFALTIGLTGGVVALLEALDNTVRGRRDMLSLLGAAPLAIVPRIVTATDVLLAKRRARLAVGVVAVACIAGVITIHLLYKPLDVLWFAALRRFGP
ncbi:MAG TPA: Wzz/FepE/Etk N-terminal domain-containing protein [Steroidobacteraceae bacterium]|nr:Wzz/FepE/Etk N-terminal domain-containing protein [Steroidobacteraceae bacterium]